MRRWLPFPLMAVALLVMWLLLNDGVSLGALILAATVSLLLTWILKTLDPPEPRLRRSRVAARLALAVLLDIIRSNFAVARIILQPELQGRRSGFVRIPLDTRNPYSLLVLACIITATPGTIWVEYDSADSAVLLHILDLVDERQWITIVKERYERPLMEIFA